jgi:2-dehydropantoate 2-reductase
MRWMVYGAGAVGGVLGARVHEAGHDVVLVARGAHLDAIRSHGLTLATPDGSRTLSVPAVARAAEVDLSEPTVVLLAVKSHQTHAAVLDLVGTAPPSTAVVCVQNGVANEPTLLRFFEQVYGVCVMMPAGHLEPGVVAQHSSPFPGILDVGRFPAGVDEGARTVAEAFRSAGFVSEPRADIMAWKHRKLLMNLGNAVQACCGSGAGTDELRDLALAEGEAVLAAAGLAVVSDADDAGRRGDLLQTREVPGHERGGGSSWQSLRRATGSIESDYLNGEIVLLGRMHSVPTPCNELLQRTAAELARRGAEPGTVPAGELLDRLR